MITTKQGPKLQREKLHVLFFFFESRNELIQKNDKHKAIATDPAPTSQENKKTKELVLS